MKKHLTTFFTTAFLLTALTGCVNENTSSENSSTSDSSSAVTSETENSQSSNTSSTADIDIKPNDYVIDSTILEQVKLNCENLPTSEIENATDGLKCETLFLIQSEGSDLNIRGLYSNNTDVVLWVSNSPNYHYFWIDNNGKELQHIAFDFDNKDVIPDYDYPNGGAFKYDGGIRYYQNGKLQKTVQLPECHRADFTPDNLKYLYINKDCNTLTLYDLETETVVKALSRNDDNRRMDFVDVIKDNLAVVTMLNTTDLEASEYNGEEKFRTLLVELPTLEVIQELPYGANLIALNDDNYIVTRQNDDVQRISFASLNNGEFTETLSPLTIDEPFEYFHSNHIILSPDKKTMLLRYKGKYDENGVSKMQCKAVSTDTMQVLWECQLTNTISAGFYTPAVITDDAVLYMSGFSFDNESVPIYRISAMD